MKMTIGAVSLLAVMVAAQAMTGAAQAKDWKTVTIAMEGAYPPYNSTDSNNKLVGFEVDLVNDLCARMKVECKLITQDWDGMIPGLEAGKYDVISDGMSITDERKQRINFAGPYAATPAAFVAPKDSPLAKMPENGKVVNFGKDAAAGEAAVKDLQAALKGLTIGVQVSTTHATFASKNLKDVATVNEYKTVDARDLDLLAGRVDAVLDDYPALADLVAKPEAKDVGFVGPSFIGGDFGQGVGFGMRKGDEDLMKMFNDALKAAFADGSVQKYSLKWFKIDTTP